jgi:NADH:ubiquinone oxidoreductase subunit D
MLKPTADILCRVHNITPKNTLDSFELINLLESLETISQELEASLDFDVKIRQLLRKKAVVTLNMAASFGLSGIYLRANRSSYEIIPTDGPPHELSEGGDAWARINLRAGELRSGITWLKQSLSTALAENKTLEPLCDNRELSIAQTVHTFSFGEISGPEGDIKISIFLDKQKIPNIHLRSPAFFIAQALPHLLAQADISDLLWILYSLGISAEEIDK